MGSIIKVNEYKDFGNNAIMTSDGAGNVTVNAQGLQNTPAFHVTLSAEQAIANSTETKIQFNTETLDTDNCYDNSTNYRFTPNVSGQYFFGSAIRFQTATDAEQCFLTIKKNGTTDIIQAYFKNYYYTEQQVSVITNMNGSSDYIEFYVHQNTGGSVNLPNTSQHQFGYGYKLIGA